MESHHTLYQPSLTEAILVALLSVASLSFLIIGMEWVPHIGIVFVMIGLLLYGRIRGINYAIMQQAMAKSLMSSVGAIYLFFFIGLLVTALIISGTMPSLMYYGTQLMSPNWFYVSVFIITSIIGISLGSSLTTIATLGVAFMGIGEAFGAHSAITAGAIVSGAFLGDKMSPLSDTTSIAASIVGVDLFEHIRNMMFTTVPAFILCCIIYGALSFSNHYNTIDISKIDAFRTALLETNLIHWYAITPLVLLIILALFRVPAVMAIIYTSVTALLIAHITGASEFGYYGNFFFSGFQPNEQWQPEIIKMLSRGGLESMFFTLTIVLLAVSMGGLLFALGVIPRLLTTIANWLTNGNRATLAVAITSISVNILIGEQYLSILLSGETYKSIYEKLSLPNKNLSRTLEDAGTVINPLVPWSVCGVFITHQLSIPVINYLPFAFFCYLSVIITLLIPGRR